MSLHNRHSEINDLAILCSMVVLRCRNQAQWIHYHHKGHEDVAYDEDGAFFLFVLFYPMRRKTCPFMGRM